MNSLSSIGRRAKIALVALAGALTLAVTVHAPTAEARTKVPSDGAPFPASDYSCVEYNFGGVTNKCGAAPFLDTQRWDIPLDMDTTGFKVPVVNANGNSLDASTVECFGVTITSNRSTIISGSHVATTTSSSAQDLALPILNLVSNASYLISCDIESSARINTVRWTP